MPSAQRCKLPARRHPEESLRRNRPWPLRKIPETLREPLSAVDHAWLRMDEPSNLMIINGALVMDEPVDFDRLQAMMRRRLLPIHRFRQRIVYHEGDPCWEDDPDLDLDYHVQRMELRRPGDEGALRDVVSELMGEPLDPGRPLWRFYLLEGYKGDGCVLMGRLHHSIGDGMALLLVLLSLTDLTPPGRRRDLDSPVTDLFRQPPRGHAAAQELAERILPDGIRLMQQSADAFRAMGAAGDRRGLRERHHPPGGPPARSVDAVQGAARHPQARRLVGAGRRGRRQGDRPRAPGDGQRRAALGDDGGAAALPGRARGRRWTG